MEGDKCWRQLKCFQINLQPERRMRKRMRKSETKETENGEREIEDDVIGRRGGGREGRDVQ